MRPSGVTPVASTTNRPAPEHANCPRCMRCQSVMQPSRAEYWHMGETTMRFGRVMPPSSIGVKSSGCGNRDSFLLERAPQLGGEFRGARLVAVQAHGVGRDGYALAAQADHRAALDHRQRLLHRLLSVLDHAAWPVARRERAVV